MKNLFHTFLAAALFCGAPLAAPRLAAAEGVGEQPAGAKMDTLVVGTIKVGKALSTASAREGRSNQLDRIAEAMDTQFRAALSSSRKFKLVVGSDLAEIMAKQKRGVLYKDDDPNAPKVGELRAPKFVIIPTIDDFQDVGERLVSEGREPMASARRIRISVVATFFDINTGEEKETTNIQVADRKTTLEKANISVTGDSKDELLMILTKQAAEKTAQRVLDVIFPAKIVALRDRTVTLNRGDGSSVAIGQVWDVFALGPELKDPDTGASLGQEEVPAGTVRITSVTPKFSKAEVIDDRGMVPGAILRLHEAKGVGGEEKGIK